MRKFLIGSVIALTLAFGGVSYVAAQTQCGGSFLPNLNCVVSGFWNWTHLNSLTSLPEPFQANGQTVTGIVSKSVDLSNSQVLALNTTAIPILPAPGAGKYYEVVQWCAAFNYTAAYSSISGNNLQLYYGTRTGGSAAATAITALGFLDASADKIICSAGIPNNTNPPTTNSAVVLANTTGLAAAGGDALNTLRVTVWFRTNDSGL